MRERQHIHLIMVVPLHDLVRDMQPLENLSAQYKIDPKHLIESLIIEWVRYHKREGQYGIVDMFDLGESAVLDFLKSVYILEEIKIVDPYSADIDRVIDLIGQELFRIMRHYLEVFSLEPNAIENLEVVKWMDDNLVLKCS